MKGEYTEGHPHHPHQQQQDIFSSSSSSKLHPHHHQQLQPYSPASASKGDGATIEVSRRPRGRPPGSKNKPKPPLIITRDSPPSMSPYILEISGGADVVSAVSAFCKRRRTALSVLAASGSVANVTLRQPAASTPAATVTFHGRFDLLSLSATVFPTASPAGGGFGITLAGPQGQVVGGAVVGPLVAAATVFVVAAAFNNPEFHRLTGDEGEEGNERGNVEDVAEGGDGDDATMSYQMETGDGVWAPTPRQPPPPGHYQ